MKSRPLIVFICFVATLLISSSCKKKQSHILASHIEIGNESEMDVIYHHNTVVGSSLQLDDKSYFMDVDQDGISDLRIRSRSNYTLIFGITKELSFNSLHTGFKLLTYEWSDSVYANFGSQQTTNQDGEPISIHAQKYSCSKDNDQAIFIESSPVNRLQHLKKGYVLNADERFTASNCFLMRMDTAYIVATNNYDGTSQIYEQYQNRKSCLYFPVNEYLYIAFKSTSEDKQERLGWIRLKTSQYATVAIDRHAIQKVD